MHDCSVRTGDAWLRRKVGPLLNLPNTAIFITFDEGASNTRGGGHVATIVAGTAVRPRSTFRLVTNHYGLLRTIEDGWGLPRLGRSARARPLTGIWR
jgi:phosphatidylinositol-3-phosphatase